MKERVNDTKCYYITWPTTYDVQNDCEVNGK